MFVGRVNNDENLMAFFKNLEMSPLWLVKSFQQQHCLSVEMFQIQSVLKVSWQDF